MGNIKCQKTYKNHKIIEVTYNEVRVKLHGIGVCDNCDFSLKEVKSGFLIPVLSSVYCEICFNEWKNRAEYYDEDKEYEDMKVKYFIDLLS